MRKNLRIKTADLFRLLQILEGEGQAKLTKMMILQTFPDINSLVGQSIYISVSVFTDSGKKSYWNFRRISLEYLCRTIVYVSGSEMVEAHRRGIRIVTSQYTIRFKGTPRYFKPGMPFDVSVCLVNFPRRKFPVDQNTVDTHICFSLRKVYVTDPDQMPVKNVEVEVNPGEVRGRTKGNGIAKFTVNSREGTSTLEITVRPS